jgi:hypothetical protein
MWDAQCAVDIHAEGINHQVRSTCAAKVVGPVSEPLQGRGTATEPRNSPGSSAILCPTVLHLKYSIPRPSQSKTLSLIPHGVLVKTPERQQRFPSSGHDAALVIRAASVPASADRDRASESPPHSRRVAQPAAIRPPSRYLPRCRLESVRRPLRGLWRGVHVSRPARDGRRAPIGCHCVSPVGAGGQGEGSAPDFLPPAVHLIPEHD